MNIESIEFKKMSFSFEGRDDIFSQVDFTFPSERVIRVSSQLTGKSTLLKILAGILPVTQGSYLINGMDVAEMSFEDFLPIRLKLGYSFDYGGLLNNKTILENLLLPLQYHNCMNPSHEARVQELLCRFKLDRNQHLRPFAIPGAQRKAACIVRAFINDPSLVILDDPDGGLKDEGVLALCQTIEEGLERGGLKKVIYASDNALMQKRLGPTEIYVGGIEIGENRMVA